MQKHHLIPLFIFFLFNLNGQTVQVSIIGTVKDSERKLLPNEEVYVLKNNDTLLKTETNDEGNFFIQTNFSVENTYRIGLLSNENYGIPIVLHQKGDSLNVPKYYAIDLGKFKIFHDFIDYTAYFEKNNFIDYSNFSTEMLKELFLEYPTICLKFIQTKNVKESNRLAKKRMTNFKEQLKLANLPMKQLLFDENFLILDESLIDQRSKIQGVVISLEGDCK